MNKRFFLLAVTIECMVMCTPFSTAKAQTLSCASFLKAREKTDVVVPFRVLDEGVETPIEWGLDLAWLSEENIHRGVNFAGKDLIDIIRTSYMPTESVEEGVLSSAQLGKIAERTTIIKRYAKQGVSLNINDDHASVDAWYNDANVSSTERGRRWAKVIDLSIKRYKELGLTNIVSISPYNEPDFGWDQGLASNRMGDFLSTAKSLREDFDGAYDGVRICGGNTLNDDKAYTWWNYLKAYLDEGNTHQLAGSFDNYATFFKRVREYGHHASADELHNTMEAMVGVEYGMQTGIWWGTCEHSRSQFMKATYHRAPGKRLAYAEHRDNWTAASVYRQTDGSIQAFGGSSERQALTTTYDFASLDRPVWFNGERGREYVMTIPGGTGYQEGQSNAETVVDVQSGTDIMPHIDGTYKIMNVNSKMLIGVNTNTSDWTSIIQKANNNSQKLQQWLVNPVSLKIGDDFSYYTITLNTGVGKVLDILNWNLNAGADVGAFKGGLGTNEQWYLEYAGNGSFYIRSRFSNKCLEVKDASTYASANVQMGDFTGAAHQQWRFIATNVVPELEAPAAPTALKATGQGCSVRLEWEASVSKDVACYTILRSEDGTDYYTIATNVTGTAFIDNEANDGISYQYKLYAVDKCYNYSEQTEAVTAATTAEPEWVVNLPFENTLNDTTENANHAAIYGNTTWVTGKVDNTALRLSGTNNFVQLPYTVANHDEITIACWVYWRGGNSWQRLWDFGNGTNQYMFFSPRTDAGMRFAIKNGGDEQLLRTSTNVATNKWVHVAVTIGQGGGVLYVNGKRSTQNANITIKPSDINPVFNYIGRSQFVADPMFNGDIDDFRIYNRALDAESIKAMYDQGNAIADVKAQQADASTTYDLSGRRVTKDSHRKGILVQGGKKIAK